MGFLGFFEKKSVPEPQYPSEYALIVYSKAALSSGLFDDYLKEIVVIKNGRLIESKHYTEEVAEAYAEHIPLYDRTADAKLQEIPIISFSDPGEISYPVPEGTPDRL